MLVKLPKPDTIMLVDDSSFDRKIVQRTVSYTKMFETILVFSGGGEALDYITDHLNEVQKLPQLILLDIQMPEMNGFEFINIFATLPVTVRSKIRVALLSSTDDLSDIAKAESNCHIVKLIKKPLHPNALLELMKEIFEMQ